MITAKRGRHTDLVLGIPIEFGLGYGLSGPERHNGPSPAAQLPGRGPPLSPR
jgi:hypothetical protein